MNITAVLHCRCSKPVPGRQLRHMAPPPCYAVLQTIANSVCQQNGSKSCFNNYNIWATIFG